MFGYSFDAAIGMGLFVLINVTHDQIISTEVKILLSIMNYV